MLRVKNIFLFLFATLVQVVALAQDTLTNKTPGKEGFMRSEGKVYVVVVVVLTILSGLIFYVARLDRKLTRLEKQGSH